MILFKTREVLNIQPSQAMNPPDSYFHLPVFFSRNPDSQSIAMLSLRRLQLEAEMEGASTSRNLFGDITHMVVYVPDGVKLSFKTILHR